MTHLQKLREEYLKASEKSRLNIPKQIALNETCEAILKDIEEMRHTVNKVGEMFVHEGQIKQLLTQEKKE